MLRSIQQIAFSMKNQTDKMNVVANNLANINTRAYKKEALNVKSFNDVMLEAMQYNSGEGKNIGSINFGSQTDEHIVVFEQGNLEQTDFKTDIALRGQGFFEIETSRGIQYTRAGNFTIDKDGYLVTQNGEYVMGENGRIYLQGRNMKVDLNGNINDGSNKFKVVAFNDLKKLVKSGGGNYINEDVANLKTPSKIDVIQGYIENSNVDVVIETRDMMEAKRNFESCQQIIKMIDDTLGKASSEIGRV